MFSSLNTGVDLWGQGMDSDHRKQPSRCLLLIYVLQWTLNNVKFYKSNLEIWLQSFRETRSFREQRTAQMTAIIKWILCQAHLCCQSVNLKKQTGSQNVVLAILELTEICLILTLKCLDYRCGLQYLAFSIPFKNTVGETQYWDWILIIY